MNITSRLAAALFCVFTGVCEFAFAAPQTAPPAGLRESSHDVHALVGGKIVVSPELTIEKGTLVIRDGVIVTVGEKVETPADARVWDCSGKTLYPGLIDG